MTMSKADQEAEAAKRAANPNERAPEIDVDTTDVSDNVDVRSRENTQEPTERTKPTVRSPFDDKRSAIINRFRENRNVGSDADEDAREIRDFAKQGMPPELSAMQQDDVSDEQGDIEEPAPQKRKVKVRGQEIELTEEELVAAAQKALAADNYLEEARTTLDDAKRLRTEIEATRTAQPAKHPVGQDGAQTAEDIVDEKTEGEHPADPIKEVIEKIQFGDPDDAAQHLRSTVNSLVQAETKKEVASSLRNQRLADEQARSLKFLTDFKEQHSDLANDPLASAAIERRIYDLQMEDMAGLGVDRARMEAQLGHPPTAMEVANWHLFYRTEGAKVRGLSDLFNTAKDDFLKWKGVDNKQQQPARQVAPRVEISADRRERRKAIPQQATRTVAPRSDVNAQQSKQPDRSAVVQNMIRQRSLPRGRVVA